MGLPVGMIGTRRRREMETGGGAGRGGRSLLLLAPLVATAQPRSAWHIGRGAAIKRPRGGRGLWQCTADAPRHRRAESSKSTDVRRRRATT